jgi:hypothetical protein
MSAPYPVPVHRLPLPADLGNDPDRLRAFARDAVMAELALQGHVTPAVRIVTGSELLVCPLADDMEPEAHASLIAGLQDHDGVRGLFRTGEVRGGGDSRQIAILQAMRHGAWWLATCDLHPAAGGWSAPDPWSERRGASAGALPPSVAHWVAAVPGQTALLAQHAQSIVSAGVQWLPREASVDPWHLANELAYGVAEALLQRSWPSDVAITVRDQSIESWVLPSNHVGGREEAMRTLTTVVRARTVALLEGQQLDDRGLEAVRVAVESDGRRTTVLVIVGTVNGQRTLAAVEEVASIRVTDANAWIGVPPIVPSYALLCGRGVHALPQA